MAESPFEVVLRACDGHEALQNFLIKNSFWIFGRFVSHEAVDECEGCL